MSLELELEAARDAAQNLAGNGEQVAAVMASEPGLAARVYLIAFGTDGEHSYLALGADLSPVHDRRLVRDAVVMLALAERAEEASAALQAEALEQEFAAAEQALRDGHPGRGRGRGRCAHGVAAFWPRLRTARGWPRPSTWTRSAPPPGGWPWPWSGSATRSS